MSIKRTKSITKSYLGTAISLVFKKKDFFSKFILVLVRVMILIVNHSNDYSLLKDIHFYVYHKTFYKGKAFPSGAFSLFEIENKKK